VRLVVLDWAGTTIDFGCRAPAGAFVAAFAARGVEVAPAEARGPMGMHKRDHVRALLESPAIAARWHDAYGRDPTEEDAEELYALVMPMQVEAAKAHSTVVPAVFDAVRAVRARDVKVAATTGYFREAAEACYAAARRQGYEPDFAVCADEVPAGRPAPWMIFRCMEALGVYPPAAVVKVGDTVIDITDGLNAGAWSVGVVDSSNEMGLSESEFAALDDADRAARRVRVRERFAAAGAHAAIDTLAELPALVAALDARLAAGQKP
jgi:phosphonoacetaldehyde hydrolase